MWRTFVGYQSLTVKPGFNLISLNFEPMNEKGEVDIQDLIQDKTPLIANTAAGSSDQIQIWDGTKFTTYFYRIKKTNNPNKFTYENCWVDSNNKGEPAVCKITKGVGVWFARPETAPTTAAITLAGAVSAEKYQHQINPGFNMIGSAFPIDIKPNDSSCPINWKESGAIANTAAGSSDQIQIWNGTAFTTYFYRVKKTNNPNKFTYENSWVDSNNKGEPADFEISAGAGFWYARPSDAAAGTLDQVSPIAK